MGVNEGRRRIITAQPHLVTASGETLGIAVAEPKVQRLAVTFAPVQSGSGTPSPSNVRPISGWSTISVALGSQTASISLGGTYYGGTVDLVSGVMTVTMVCETHTWGTGYTYQQTIGSVEMKIWPLSNNTSDITVVGNSLCSIAPWEVSFMADRTHYYTAAGGGGQHNLYIALPVGTSKSTTFTHCYDLQTPYTVTLTPQTIAALRGQQTVKSPAGAVEISYWTH